MAAVDRFGIGVIAKCTYAGQTSVTGAGCLLYRNHFIRMGTTQSGVGVSFYGPHFPDVCKIKGGIRGCIHGLGVVQLLVCAVVVTIIDRGRRTHAVVLSCYQSAQGPVAVLDRVMLKCAPL